MMLRLFVILTTTEDLALAWVINVAEWLNSNDKVFMLDLPTEWSRMKATWREVLNENIALTLFETHIGNIKSFSQKHCLETNLKRTTFVWTLLKVKAFFYCKTLLHWYCNKLKWCTMLSLPFCTEVQKLSVVLSWGGYNLNQKKRSKSEGKIEK